jgi:hypothetical protein
MSEAMIFNSTFLALSNLSILIICLKHVQRWFGLAKQLREEHKIQAVAP